MTERPKGPLDPKKPNPTEPSTKAWEWLRSSFDDQTKALEWLRSMYDDPTKADPLAEVRTSWAAAMNQIDPNVYPDAVLVLMRFGLLLHEYEMTSMKRRLELIEKVLADVIQGIEARNG